MPETITVSARVKAPVDKVWVVWTKPMHIVKWNQASADWHCPRATNDLRVGGKFVYRMESRDGKMGFDFGGTYMDVKPEKEIAYILGDGRKVTVTFATSGGETVVTEVFEAETKNSPDRQCQGWQAILDRFKKYAETGK